MTATPTSPDHTPITDIASYCDTLGAQALKASRSLARVSGAERAAALHGVAELLIDRARLIESENAKDLEAAEKNGLSQAMVDRLKLDDARIIKMANSVRQIADQIDPVGQVIEGYVRPNGLRLQKVRVPLGVVLIIFESRPNVTSDAAALCLKSGNAVILRGGKEAIHSNRAIADCVREALVEADIDPNVVQLVDTTDRAAVGHLLKMDGTIDLAIPRGGKSLIKAVVEQAHIPVIKHYTGNCHVYVDQHADADMASAICVNAKTQRTGVCNAAETLLFHKACVETGLVARICKELADAGVELRGDKTICEAFPDARPANEEDWDEEYLDMIVALRVVDSLDEAVDHINQHGSRHTDAIVTNHIAEADRFVEGVDTANAFVNCSTRFSDGAEYGLGAEIGISTDKLHARGPMGALDLTTYKWVARGNGQVRE